MLSAETGKWDEVIAVFALQDTGVGVQTHGCLRSDSIVAGICWMLPLNLKREHLTCGVAESM